MRVPIATARELLLYGCELPAQRVPVPRTIDRDRPQLAAARVRRRDGAYQWGIYRDIEVATRFVEIFLVHSWAEHLRQHERQTKADSELEQRVYSFVVGEPKVRHLLYADSTNI